MGTHFTRQSKIKKSTNKISGVRMDATDSNGKKKIFYGYIEEIRKLDYGPNFKETFFVASG